MAAQEERHLARFNALMAERRVRPTLLQPFWSVAGFALGAATARGPRASDRGRFLLDDAGPEPEPAE